MLSSSNSEYRLNPDKYIISLPESCPKKGQVEGLFIGGGYGLDGIMRAYGKIQTNYSTGLREEHAGRLQILVLETRGPAHDVMGLAAWWSLVCVD